MAVEREKEEDEGSFRWPKTKTVASNSNNLQCDYYVVINTIELPFESQFPHL